MNPRINESAPHILLISTSIVNQHSARCLPRATTDDFTPRFPRQIFNINRCISVVKWGRRTFSRSKPARRTASQDRTSPTQRAMRANTADSLSIEPVAPQNAILDTRRAPHPQPPPHPKKWRHAVSVPMEDCTAVPTEVARSRRRLNAAHHRRRTPPPTLPDRTHLSGRRRLDRPRRGP